MKKYFAIIPGLFLVACTTTKTATPAQTAEATPKQPTYTAEQLSHGKDLYSQNCASCHSLKQPTSETAEDWKHIVPDMVAKANRKNPNAIDANTEKVILDYLVAMSTPQTK